MYRSYGATFIFIADDFGQVLGPNTLIESTQNSLFKVFSVNRIVLYKFGGLK